VFDGHMFISFLTVEHTTRCVIVETILYVLNRNEFSFTSKS